MKNTVEDDRWHWIHQGSILWSVTLSESRCLCGPLVKHWIFLPVHSWVTSYNLLWNEQDLAEDIFYLMGNITSKMKRNGYKAVVFVTWICQSLLDTLSGLITKLENDIIFFFFMTLVNIGRFYNSNTNSYRESKMDFSRDYVGLNWWSSGEDSPATIGGTGLIPILGRLCMPRGQLNPHAVITKDWAPQLESSPSLLQLEKACKQQQGPTQPKSHAHYVYIVLTCVWLFATHGL